jgi:pyruvate,water dikinase
VLSGGQARSLADLGRRIEVLFGEPQDVEWALADGRCWVLQARPITALGMVDAAPGAAPAALHAGGEILVTGTPASPGTASGPVGVVLGLDDFARFSPGDVLVCRTTSPAWTPLLARAAAVVTETGGMLSHAAIVAREFGIPAVLAAGGATTVLAGRGAVLVDGSRGLVTRHRRVEPNA